jgi:hypothetical protein
MRHRQRAPVEPSAVLLAALTGIDSPCRVCWLRARSNARSQKVSWRRLARPRDLFPDGGPLAFAAFISCLQPCSRAMHPSPRLLGAWWWWPLSSTAGARLQEHFALPQRRSVASGDGACGLVLHLLLGLYRNCPAAYRPCFSPRGILPTDGSRQLPMLPLSCLSRPRDDSPRAAR